MDRVERLERSSYTIDLTIMEGTVDDRQSFTGSRRLGVKASELSQSGTSSIIVFN